MPVAAQLHGDPGGRSGRQIGRHARGGAAVEPELRFRHASVTDRQELCYPGLALIHEDRHRVRAIGSRGPVSVTVTGHRLAHGPAGGTTRWCAGPRAPLLHLPRARRPRRPPALPSRFAGAASPSHVRVSSWTVPSRSSSSTWPSRSGLGALVPDDLVHGGRLGQALELHGTAILEDELLAGAELPYRK